MATITDNDLKMFQERARTEFSGCDVGGIAWDSVIWDLCNEVRRLRSVSKERGNAAKLREAVGYIAQYADSAAMRQHDATTQHYIEQMRKWAQSALAEPPRNCDKYATADEALKAQEQMFNDSNFANGECKLGCPECDNPRVGCKIAWLFAPATEKEGGAK